MHTDEDAAAGGPRERTLVGYAPAPMHPSTVRSQAVDHPPLNIAGVSITNADGRVDVDVDHGSERRNPLSRRRPINRGRDLTKKFFEEGEKHQRSGWEDSVLADEPPTADPRIRFDSFDRVPMRRGPLLVGALSGGVALALLTSWAMGWPATSAPPESTVWSALQRPGAGWKPPSAIRTVPAATVPAPGRAPTPTPTWPPASSATASLSPEAPASESPARSDSPPRPDALTQPRSLVRPERPAPPVAAPTPPSVGASWKITTPPTGRRAAISQRRHAGRAPHANPNTPVQRSRPAMPAASHAPLGSTVPAEGEDPSTNPPAPATAPGGSALIPSGPKAADAAPIAVAPSLEPPPVGGGNDPAAVMDSLSGRIVQPPAGPADPATEAPRDRDTSTSLEAARSGDPPPTATANANDMGAGTAAARADD